MHGLPALPPPGAKGHRPPVGPPPPSLAPRGPQPVNRTRPVFPYPLVARYVGKGDVDDAGSFVAAQPAHVAAIPAWRGSSFYAPGFQKQCAVANGQLACH